MLYSQEIPSVLCIDRFLLDSGVVSGIALRLKVGTVVCRDVKYRTVIFSNCLLLDFRGWMLGEEKANCVSRSFCNIFASQYFKDGLGKKIAIKRLRVRLVVSNRGVRVLPSFPLLGNIDLSVCTFSFMLWESIYLGGR